MKVKIFVLVALAVIAGLGACSKNSKSDSKSKECKIVSFKVNGVPWTNIDHDAGTIKHILDGKSIDQLVGLVPEIVCSEGATVSPRSGDTRDFSEPVNYTVTAENGKDTKTYIVTASVGGQ